MALFFAGLEAWSTFAGVLAAFGAAIGIVVQIGLTRKSLRQTQDSLADTKRAINESRKQRIDEEMPKLAFTILRNPGEARVQDFDAFVRQESALLVPDGTVYRTPKDDGVILHARTRVRLRNDGPRQARIAVYFPLARSERLDFDVAPKKEIEFEVDRIMQLNHWIALNKLRNDPSVPVMDSTGTNMTSTRVTILEATYTFPGDVGAIETHRIEQDGLLMWPVHNEDGAWHVGTFAPGNDNLTSYVPPFQRIYFDSISANRQME